MILWLGDVLSVEEVMEGVGRMVVVMSVMRCTT